MCGRAQTYGRFGCGIDCAFKPKSWDSRIL